MTPEPPTGVLVMAHGTPAAPGEIESFYTSIRRGRPPTPELLAELVGRYEAIGGTSPLRQRTRAQVEALATALDAAAPGWFVVRYGSKHTTPTIEEGVAELAGAECDPGGGHRPHAALFVGGYRPVLRTGGSGDVRAMDPSIELVPVDSWFRAPGFAQVLADRVRSRTRVAARARSCQGRSRLHRPQRADRRDRQGRPLSPGGRGVGCDDRRPGRAGALAGGLAKCWTDGDEWLGPNLLDEIRSIGAEGSTGRSGVPSGIRVRTTWRSSSTWTSRPQGLRTRPASPLSARPR